MGSESPIDILMHEHRVIERMVSVISTDVETITREERVDPAYIDTIVDFIRTFADGCHHAKEEGVLFRRLFEKSIDTQLAMTANELTDEHAIGRDLASQLAGANERYRAGDDTTITIIQQSLEGLVNLYPPHIAKEEDDFFERAIGHFDDHEREAMIIAFDELEVEVLHKKYENLLEALEKRVASSHLMESAAAR